MGSIKGIIFDMDNTILKSNIDFGKMKSEVFEYLVANEVLSHDFPIHQHTTSSLINHVQRAGLMTGPMQTEIWGITTKHEVAGMKDAELEPGVSALLNRLKNHYKMVVLTNNSYSAAKSALNSNNIDSYFEHIIAREQMEHMKPAPDGIFVILNLYKEIASPEWLSVGDSWIDGKAAQDAGVKFISYQGDLAKMNSMGVSPIGEIQHISELVTFLR